MKITHHPSRTITRSGYDLTPGEQEEIWDRIPANFQAMDIETNIRLDARQPERLARALVQHWHKQGRTTKDGRKWRKR